MNTQSDITEYYNEIFTPAEYYSNVLSQDTQMSEQRPSVLLDNQLHEFINYITLNSIEVCDYL